MVGKYNESWCPMYEVYVGGYRSAELAGIHHLQLDEESGQLRALDRFSGIDNPSYLLWDGSRQHLYAVSESHDRARVASYHIDDNGRLQLENSEATSGGSPCHLTMTADRQGLLCTNYMGASVDWFPLDSTGRLYPRISEVRHTGSGPRKDRQSQAHPHSAWTDPSGLYVIVPDLGLDRLLIYRPDLKQKALQEMARVAVPPGSGPRHLAFHSNGQFVYVVNELSSTVSVFTYRPEPLALELVDTVSALPQGFRGSSDAAHIIVSCDGTMLYVSNRGSNTIACFAIEDQGQRLRHLADVPTIAHFPRHFSLSPDERWMLVGGQKADVVEVMSMQNGIPTPHGSTFSTPQPTFIAVG